MRRGTAQSLGEFICGRGKVREEDICLNTAYIALLQDAAQSLAALANNDILYYNFFKPL